MINNIFRTVHPTLAEPRWFASSSR